MDSFRSSPRCRNGAVYGTRVGRKIGFPEEVAQQADTPAGQAWSPHTETRSRRLSGVRSTVTTDK
ncbi:hypothetical protein N7516_002633 [Penicillium verrucosum]|uniref:uncharacterized protein n=1 Tax=Penicillium verrucosum TaxID=60171 RepID=UPI002544EC09|nr:uncharacterized protein N7516_002633 [Penicillium verrucosum]KAJ5942465.1 hypothetical protein N7516_002633 [Penicillium verrucosum]